MGVALREDFNDGDLESLGMEVASDTAMAAVSGGVCLRKILAEVTGEEISDGGGVVLADALEEGLGIDIDLVIDVGGDVSRRRIDLIDEGRFAGVEGREVMAPSNFGEEEVGTCGGGKAAPIKVSVRAGHGVETEALQEEGGVGGNSHVGREKLTIGLMRTGSDFVKVDVDGGGGLSAGVGGRRDLTFASGRAGHGFETDPVEEGGEGKGAGPEANRGARGGVVGSACLRIGFIGGLRVRAAISSDLRTGECFWIGNTKRSKVSSEPPGVFAPGESGGCDARSLPATGSPLGVGSLFTAAITASLFGVGSLFTAAITGVILLPRVGKAGSGETGGLTDSTGGGVIGSGGGVCFRGLGEGAGMGAGSAVGGRSALASGTDGDFFGGLTICVGVNGLSSVGVCLLGIFESALGIRPGD